MLKAIAVVLSLLMCLYAGLLAWLYWRQESLLFPGQKLPEDYRFNFPVPFEERFIEVDGATLNALHFRQPDPRGVIFFLHGNGGNLQGWTENIEYYQQVNYDLFIFDYRGYGKSSGRYSSQEQLIADVRAAWKSMQQAYDQALPVVIYGRSLGTALGVHLAREVEAQLLVLVSPFIHMQAMAQRRFPYVPGAILRYPLRTDQMITQVEQPIVILHGSDDGFIPADHSRSLHALVSDSSELFIIDGAEHNDIHTYDDYLSTLTRLLAVTAETFQREISVDNSLLKSAQP